MTSPSWIILNSSCQTLFGGMSGACGDLLRCQRSVAFCRAARMRPRSFDRCTSLALPRIVHRQALLVEGDGVLGLLDVAAADIERCALR